MFESFQISYLREGMGKSSNKLYGIFKRYGVIMLGLLSGGFYIGLRDIRLFIGVTQILIMLLIFHLLMTILNAYKVQRDGYLGILGIAYCCSVVLYLIYFFIHFDFEHDVYESYIRLQGLWLLIRYIEVGALLILYSQQNNFQRGKKIYIAYIGVIALLFAFQIHGGDSGIGIVDVIQSVVFRRLMDFILSIFIGATAVMIYRRKRYSTLPMDDYFYLAILLTACSQVLSLMGIGQNDFPLIVMQLFKVLTVYLIHRGIGDASLMKLYEDLARSYDDLEEKNKELESMNGRLAEEIEIRGQIEDNLNQERKMLKTILNATADGIMVQNDRMELIHYNTPFQEMWQIPDDLLHEGNINVLLKYAKKYVKNSEGFEMKSHEVIETSSKTKDILEFKGERFYERITTPMVLDNRRIGRVWSFRDITKDKENEIALQKREKHYRHLVDMIPDAVMVHRNNRFLYVNEACLKLFDVADVKKIIGKNILDFAHSDDRQHMYKSLQQKKGKISTNLLQHRIISAMGQEKDIEAITTVLYENEERTLLTIMRDVTERRKMEQLEMEIEVKEQLLMKEKEYDELKTEFFCNISHDLKTPINVIFSSLQMLQMYMQGDKIIDHMDKANRHIYTMRQNSFRLLKLVNDIVDMNRIESGYYQFELESHNLIHIIEDITLSVATYMENQGIEFVFDTDVEEKWVQCDPYKVERIMLNLLSNAVKFTDEGGRIEVNIFNKEEWVVIEVKDTGVGIAKDKQDMVFEKFGQVKETLARNSGGSGLGLPLVKSLIELHGGTITLESEVHKGTTFTIKLPTALHIEEETRHEVATAYEGNVERIDIEFSDIYK